MARLEQPPHGGMYLGDSTILDMFAAHALAVIIEKLPEGFSPNYTDVYAERAYRLAKAMVEERKKWMS